MEEIMGVATKLGRLVMLVFFHLNLQYLGYWAPCAFELGMVGSHQFK